MSEKSDTLSLIGKRIKEIRKQEKLSLKEVALRTGVSTGLLSKIENFRAVPSLPVLFNLAKALGVTMSELVSYVRFDNEKPFMLVRKSDRELENREDSVGLNYETIMGFNFGDVSCRANIVTIEPLIYRPPISTAAEELIFVIKGNLLYGIGNEEIDLQEGDALFFDGNIPHSVKNLLNSNGVMFKVYFFTKPTQ